MRTDSGDRMSPDRRSGCGGISMIRSSDARNKRDPGHRNGIIAPCGRRPDEQRERS